MHDVQCIMNYMKRDVLKQVIADQQTYRPPKDFFTRTLTAQIRQFKDDPNIIILSGLRRSGKSTIQRALQKELAPSNCYFNFDDERLVRFHLDDFQMLLEIFIEFYGDQKTFYFDEIQNIKGWERFARRLSDQGKKLYITGSNANLLSKELGTHLTGRYVQFEVYPLSFLEIVQHKHPDILSKKTLSTIDIGTLQGLFSNYLLNGGIPEFVKFQKAEYLKDLLEGILYRDILTRHKIKDERSLREVVYYFASNIGKEFSYTKLGSYVGINSPHTIRNYCTYLEQCYLCFFITRYDHSLKKQMQSNKKAYMIDPALIRLTGFRTSEDRGRILENIVFLHLKAKDNEIYFHKNKKECDFLLRESNKIVQAIQVTTAFNSEETKEREIEGLMEAINTYQLKGGLILTESEEEILEIEGKIIAILPIWKWLLQ